VLNPEGHCYSRLCKLYRIWDLVTMRQTQVGGDKVFVDYAGDTAPVIADRLGEDYDWVIELERQPASLSGED
jgi:transposase